MTAAAGLLAGPGGVLGVSAAVVGGLFLVIWLLSLRLADASIVDPVWGPSFAIVGLLAAALGAGAPGRRWLLFALTAVWATRLGWHLTARRRREREEDRRYRALREQHPEHFPLWSLGWIFLVQAGLVLVISLPLQVAAQRPSALGWAAVPGVLVYVVGLLFETVGDEQLRRFRADPARRDAVLDRGLWRYTRHPNYFGDACIWWGLWLVAVPAGGTWWTVVSPVVMTALLLRVSGKGLLERDIAQRRPDYVRYVERTSGFLPRPPRSG